jgi:predicted nucleic acid-binding protein
VGVVLDTSVFVALEKRAESFDFDVYKEHGDVFISAVTASELLVGVHYADTDARRARRAAFVEALLASLDVLDFTREIARVHAQLYTSLKRKGQLIGAHDVIIAATALYYGFPIVTENLREFERVEGLQVLPPPVR